MIRLPMFRGALVSRSASHPPVGFNSSLSVDRSVVARRGFLARVAAALAIGTTASAATAIAGPEPMAAPSLALLPATPLDAAPIEETALLDLGRKTAGVLDGYQSALAAKREARALADRLAPAVPEDLVVRHPAWRSCATSEEDLEGKIVYQPDEVLPNGKRYARRTRFVLASHLMKEEIRSRSVPARSAWGRRLRRLVTKAERYERSKRNAALVAGLDKSNAALCDAEITLWQHCKAIAEIEPRGRRGGVIYAQALLAGLELGQSERGYRSHAEQLLGPGLARVAIAAA